MNKSKLTAFQFSSMIIFPILALFSGVGTHNIIKIAKVDAYISSFLSFIIGIFPLLLFLLIFNYKKELSITEKINYLFGKYLGFLINMLICILVLFIGVILLYNVTNFAISQFLSETPLIVFMILIGIIIVYNVSKGIDNISRVSIIFLILILFLTLISTFGILPNFDVSNLKPFLENGISLPLKGGISLTLTSVIPIYLLLIVNKNSISEDKKTNKYILIFYVLSYFLIILASILTIGSLGIYLSEIYQYPEYTVLKKISLFNFIDRIENFIYIKWIFSSVISLSLIVYYIKENIRKKSNRLVPSVIVILMIILSLTILKSSTIFYYVSSNIYPYVCLMLFMIYIIIGLNIVIRKLLDG